MTTVTETLNKQASGWTDSSSAASQELDKDAFLKLLITQLSNQDPTSPMKNEEFVAQLAQFSSLEQLVGANERLDALAVGQMAQSGATAVSFIGKGVRMQADWLEADGTGPVAGSMELGSDAATVNVRITDSNGNLVKTIELKDQKAGKVAYLWDGTNSDNSPVAAGTYTVSIEAKDAEGNAVSATPTNTGVVTGLTYRNGYPELMVGDHTLTLSDIIEVIDETEVP